MRTFILRLAVVVTAMMCGAANALDVPPKPDGAIRFATYNVSLHGEREGEIVSRLATPDDRQAQLSATVIQRVRPDVLLVQEIDRDGDGRALAHYADNYLARAQGGEEAILYPHRIELPTNTGEPSGIDLSGDGEIGTSGIAYAVDAKGFGRYPGQYGFSILSRLPLGPARTFSDLLWRDMPGHRMPPNTSQAVRDVLPLSSKTHALIPVAADGVTIHVIAAHPTPPIRANLVPRNADEIRLAVDLLHEARSQYAVDDAGV
ncbi:MAG: endonuclease/exonuclease/phosphatase family protein, partial [Pseudomonadota bacterium]